ncbi:MULTISPECIES: isochorismatase family protein [Gammaproteobacteria]|uniref:isochorismatase family protein n=1 Tax=Gammaproteobacteria TaxID=1236 RepID=UPI001ADC8FCB|nr:MULTISPECIES: isochorismatase family protein [Gammaproteobacteria]MBO9484379.1 isochorismatase family protein [Salinisphaera sp. G21_0]MBO9495860.1 isochorismatase family protein [Thalassotalea sp. G20_0]
MQRIRPAILLIDVDEPSMDNLHNEMVLKSHETILKQAAKAGLPIFDIILHGQRTIDRLRHIIEQSQNYISYRKNMESAFDEDNILLMVNGQRMRLIEYLRSISCKHIFIMGYADDDCVFETAFDALNLGLNVYVDRMFNLGVDLNLESPWNSITHNPRFHMYTAIGQSVEKKCRQLYRVYNMRIM